MLKKITIKNFKCFKNETEIDFRKTNYKLLEQNTEGKLLKGLLFVGENASGKTTAIQPVTLLLQMLFKDTELSLVLYHCLFGKERATSLKYEFEIDGHDIEYSFSFSINDILEEELKLDCKQIIKRINQNAKLSFGEEDTFHEIDKSILFLRKLYFNTKFEGNDVLQKWFEFLKNSVWINAYSKEIHNFTGTPLFHQRYFEEYGTDKVNNFLDSNNFKYTVQYSRKMGKGENEIEFTEEQDKVVFLERKDIDIPIPLFLESTGNQTLINILPAILHAVENGGLLVIDEFSSGLHNKLEELLVKYIMNNSKKTQLIFVSHSTNLLSNSLLRPDQIYTVEFNGSEGSSLSKFSDEQPRVAQNLEKMYLSGVFGGIPEYGTEDK